MRSSVIGHRSPGASVRPLAPRVDEAAARRALRGQVARLERELCELLCSAWQEAPPEVTGAPGIRAAGASPAGAALQSVGELERLRDELAERARRARVALEERGRAEEENRERLERMLLAPERHGWMHVSSADIGEPGCRNWYARPRFGLLGLLAGWWRVVVSSGCP